MPSLESPLHTLVEPSAEGMARAGARARLVAWRPLAAWWVASRALVVATAIVVHLLHRPRGFFGPIVAHHALGLLRLWDGTWYARVAEHGYLLVPAHQSDPAFFPLYPIVLEGSELLGVSAATAGIVVSNLSLLVAIVAVYELGRRLLPERDAYRGAVAVAIFPFGYVFSMVYPEALVLAAIALAGLFAMQDRWSAAAAAAALAALGRPEGAFLAIPLAATALAHRHRLTVDGRGRAAAAVAAGPLALAAFPLYLGWKLHDPFAWQRAETRWGRRFRVRGVYRAFTDLPSAAHLHPWLWRDLAALVVYLALLGIAWRGAVPRAWLAMAAVVVLLPLGSGSVESEGRFGLLALPIYWGVAVAGRARAAWLLLQVSCLLLLVAGTVSLKLSFP